MATTLATEKQATAIKQRMAEIRTDLPYSADVARARVQQLTDWRYHLSRHPLPIVAAAVVAGYLLVPRKRVPDRVIVHRDSAIQADVKKPVERGMFAGIAAAVGTMLLRQAATAATAHFTDRLSKRGTR